jgi:transglutaminase-like putative cysteine protease
MRICVAHETVYRYDAPCTGVIQTLRLTPRNHAGQYVMSWRIDVSANCRLEPAEDAFGNVVHTFSLAGPVSELRLMVDGEVETQDTAGVVRGAVERFPPSLYLRETALTRPDAALVAYAAQFPRPDAASTLPTLHSLLACLHQDIAMEAGAESATKPAPAADEAPLPAADVLKAGRGTSQDMAHVFIAVVRALGVPARYVAGYLRHDGGAGIIHQGGDAWSEVHVPGLGWVGFDPANGICSTDQHVRVSIGLDCLGAAPVRGFHYGGVHEDVAVRLAVTQASRQTQG